MAHDIADYAMIGDCQTAALVGRDGSIDWLCVPRFDSGAVFAALLGKPEHGHWQIAPGRDVSVQSVRRRYRGDTLVLETVFQTDAGTVALIDFMPPRGRVPDIVRIVEGRDGEVPMDVELIMRFDYGSIVPWVQRSDSTLTAIAGPDMLRLITPVPLHGCGLTTVGQFVVKAGERVPFVLTWYPSHQVEPSEVDPITALDDTETWWSDWSALTTYQGRWRDQVVRSLIALKALTYEPTGGIVAAATTSLPEKIGGERNWDYRFCWLRDATFSLYAMLLNGHQQEARAWREWLLRAAAGDPAKLRIMYGIAGERRLTEWEADWLPGFLGSRPIRIGNAASDQHQLDVYGEVLDTMFLARKVGIEPHDHAWELEKTILSFLETDWVKPDNGIWEVRGPRRHFTHSKVMAWVAFDRGIRSVEQFGRPADAEQVNRWRAARAAIHAEVCARGFNSKRNTFVQAYDLDRLDASLLMMAPVGFLPPEDPRVVGTVEAIERELSTDGFVDRYETHPDVDGLPPGEGAFLACSFWLVDNLALIGRHDEAVRLFEKLLTTANDVGLMSEEVDAHDLHMLGNFPQALSHLALINSAHNLVDRVGPAQHRHET